MPQFDSNITWNIYCASIGSEILKFARTISDMNTFVTLSNRLLKMMQKQESKYRSITSMLNKVFGKHFTVFNVFTDITANFIKPFSLPWIKTIYIHVCLLQNLFLLFVFPAYNLVLFIFLVLLFIHLLIYTYVIMCNSTLCCLDNM